MADVPIERDNALVRRLNAVAKVNEEMGTPLGGGSRSTVLPPAPRPVEGLGPDLSQQELEVLEAEWANDPSNPLNQARAQGPPAEPGPPVDRLSAREFLPSSRRGVALPVAATGPDFGTIAFIEVASGTMITDTGRRLGLSPEETLEVKKFVFTAALQSIVRETNQQLIRLRNALGLPEPVQEPVNGTTDPAVEGLHEVQGGEAEGSVPPEPSN